MQFELHFENHGCPELTIKDVTGSAFRNDVRLSFSWLLGQESLKIDEGAAAVITIPCASPTDALRNDSDWTFKASLFIDQPQSDVEEYCAGDFQAAGARRCSPIGKVTFVDAL
jgi:hypothetical protein